MTTMTETDGRVLRMWRVLAGDLPEPRWPDGVRVRTYGRGDGVGVKALLDEAYAGWDDRYERRTQADWERWMTAHDEFAPELWFLVEQQDDLVACALHWRESDRHRPEGDRRGWVKDLAVRADFRGRGLGRALLYTGFRAYAERGVRRVGLKVETRNPTGALRLYESVGFVVDPDFDGSSGT